MSESDETNRFEEFLEREARAYNAPTRDVPRETMWTAIQAARAEVRAGSAPNRLTLDATTSMRSAAVRQRRLAYAWMGMAATLIIGVAIGKVAFGTRATPMTSAPPAAVGDSASPAYRVAATEHLARAEALLTAFGTSVHDSATDAQLSKWARDILSNTRLLLDSPAASDPSRRRLLEDLERVLVQIMQRSPTAGASEERAQVERSMERTQVLPRLRSAQLPGVNSGT
jgi:hypothetical protein